MKEKFTVVALPKEEDLFKLNLLKEYFYKNNFRTKEYSGFISDAHITLGCFEIENRQLEKNLNVMSKFEIKEPFLLESFYPVNVEREFDNWVSIIVESDDLQELSKNIQSELGKLDINTTDTYIKQIKELKKDNRKTFIADHINICNYCKKDKSNEALNYLKENIPESITINKIGIRDQEGSIIYRV